MKFGRCLPKFHHLATLASLSATAMTTAARAESPGNTAQATLEGTATVTQVTITTVSSTTTVTESLPAVIVTETVTVEPATAPAAAPAPEDVYFANCSEARAAGTAPIYVGELGYRSKMDRDGDGLACE